MTNYINELEEIKERIMPSRKQLISILQRLGMSDRKLEHSQETADFAVAIAQEVEKDGIKVDKKIVEAGALLHDIGIVYMLDDLSPEHSVIGADMIRKLGLPERVAMCAETHEPVIWEEAKEWKYPVLPLKETYMPQTIEEKIVTAADFFIYVLKEGPEDYGYEKYDLWKNPDEAIIELFYSYCKDVYKKKLGKDIDKNHPMIKRGYELYKPFLKYIKKDFF